MKRFVNAPLYGLVLVLLHPMMACHGQDVHPQKTHYQDAPSWPSTQPGEVTLQNFRPFRAVYQRTYTNGSGQARTDRVIITAEHIGWEGHEAIALTLTDTGDPAFEDTNARTLIMYVKQEDLSVLLEIGPTPGTAKDYYLARQMTDTLTLNQVTTATDAHQFRAMGIEGPGFGPGTWVIASMPLHTGQKIQLAQVYSPRANALTGFTTLGYVAGQEPYTDLSGNTYTAWMVEHTSNLASPVLARRPLIDRPPYLLGTEILNLDTGDKRDAMRLISWAYLDGE